MNQTMRRRVKALEAVRKPAGRPPSDYWRVLLPDDARGAELHRLYGSSYCPDFAALLGHKP